MLTLKFPIVVTLKFPIFVRLKFPIDEINQRLYCYWVGWVFFGGFFRDPFTVQKHFSGRIQGTHFNHPNATAPRNTSNGRAYMATI